MTARLPFLALALAGVLAAGLAAAAKYDATQVVTARTKAAFADQAESVRRGLEPGGRYEFVERDERGVVERRLAEIQSLFDGYAEGARLPDQSLVALLNAQEEINAILTRRDANRLVCTHAAPTGSHLPKDNCKRYGDIQRARRDTEKWMWDRGAPPKQSHE
jgi:hypothetical protein